jgi:outer membrane protein assembly factor BamB
MSNRITVSECPNCGAPIDPSAIADSANPSCPFCHTALPVEQDPPPAPVFTGFSGVTSGLIDISIPRVVRGRKRLFTVFLLFALIFGASVGIPLLATHAAGLGSSGGSGSTEENYAIYGPVVLASGSATNHDAYVIAPNLDTTGTPVLRRVDLQTKKIVWSSAAIASQSGTPPTVVPDGAKVLVIADTNVLALDAATGKQLWEGSLSNDLQNPCVGGCAIVIGSDLVTLAKDGTVQSLAVSSGKQLWSRRLADTPDFLQAAGGLAAVVSSPKAPAYDLLLFNPANGVTHVVAPSCAPDGDGDLAVPDEQSDFSISPDGTTVTVLIDGPGGCVASYRIPDGKRLWRTKPDAGNAVIPFDLTAESDVNGPDVIAWTNEIGSDRWVFTVNTVTGKIHQLIDTGNQDGTTGLDGVVGNTIVMEVAPSYASDQPGIYGVSLKTGKQLWMDASRVTSAADDGSQTVITTVTGVVIVSCKSSADGSSGSCLFEAVDPLTGDITGNLNVDDLDPAPMVDQVTVGSDEVLGNVDSGLAVAFNATSGAFEGQWPPTS